VPRHRLNPDPAIALFTDGSSYTKDRSGGWAWLALDINEESEIGMGGADDTTNNRMEMQAWIEGLTYLFRVYGPITVLVYSDSEYVGLGATNRSRKRNNNVDLWLALDEAIDRHEYVEFNHVKGHQKDGSYYNHLVDEMAGEARKAFHG
jgi:ribonuclease HI